MRETDAAVPSRQLQLNNRSQSNGCSLLVAMIEEGGSLQSSNRQDRQRQPVEKWDANAVLVDDEDYQVMANPAPCHNYGE